jgi:PEGA domain
MKNSILRPLFISIVLIITLSAQNDVPGQIRPPQIENPPKENQGRKKGPIRPPQIKVVPQKVIETIVINPKANVGHLSIVAITKATVTLTPILEAGKKPTVIKETIREANGSLNLINLPPGKYQVHILHEDFQPLDDTIQIHKANLATYVARDKLESRYGKVHVAGVPQGAKIYWNEKPIVIPVSSRDKPDDYINSLLDKVLVGKYKLKVSKEGFQDMEKEVDVLPGKETFEPVQLPVALVTLNLISSPDARVYVNDEYRGMIISDGNLSIKLFQGQHKIRVSKDGFKEWSRDLTISLANSPVKLEANLIPIPPSAEGNWEPDDRENKWYPEKSGWVFEKSGATIRGDNPVLFDTEINSDFNNYQNVRLEFHVVFSHGKGVNWVVRAKDSKNYYLFELTGKTGTPSLNFYICQDGKLHLKDKRRVLAKLDVKDDTFHIIFEAKGERFETRMNIRSAPAAEPRLIGIFQDNLFTIGGIGFRGMDQSETLLKAIFVFPQK